MKKLFLMAAVLGGMTMATSHVMAEHHEGAMDAKTPHMEKKMAIDTDGDKKVSKAEFMAKQEAKFAKMDVDGDGYLSREEMKEAHGKMKDKMKEMRAKRMDKMEEMAK